MFRVGLTGGIASGKTTVADLFAARDVTVLDTDVIAREVVEPGRPALGSLVRALGTGILDADGRLDRRELRHRLFDDAALRREVESILHPAIIAELERQALAAPGPYQIFVIPLLVENRFLSIVDRVLVVDCPAEVRVRRLMERDGETREAAWRILSAQATRDERLAAADDVIDNSGTPGDLTAQVAALDAKYRELAART